MLQLIRDRATGWIAWVIIILICIPFALWGVNQYFEPDQGLVVASVDDSEISYYQYRNAVQQQRARLQQMLGGSVSADLLDSPQLREQVLQSLIDDEAVLQGSIKSGLRIGDVQVANTIRSMPVFQENGAFSADRYNSLLRAQGLTSQGFELDLRRSMLSDQVSAAFRGGAIVTQADVDSALQVRNEQRVVKLITIEPTMLKVKAPDEQAISAWYESNKDRFVAPEQVSIRHVVLSRDVIAKTITAPEDELRAIYEQRKEQGSFGLPEQREARHILIELAADGPPEAVATARASIDAARQRIVNGEDFAAVAREVSQDAGSAPLGGDLGQFGRGVMDSAFEDAAFALQVGQISDPVRSRFGWHLIEVTAIQPAKVRSYDEARADVLTDYQSTQADEIFAEQAERLATLGFENPESLEVASQTLDLPINTSGFFSRSGERAEGITANPRVRDAAFSPDVLEAGNNSELIEVDADRRVLLRVAERKPSRQQPLDEVREDVIAALGFENAAKQATELGEAVLKGLREGSTIDAIAASQSDKLATAAQADSPLQWSDSKTLTRDLPTGVPSAVAQRVFRMPAPDGADKPSLQGVALPSGGYAVVALSEISQVAIPADEEKQRREQIAREIAAARGMQTFDAVQRVLRSRANVVINQQNMRPDDG